MTNTAHTIRDKLLDAKRHLEKAQSEVNYGANDPEVVSVFIEAALKAVMDGLKASGGPL